MDSEEDIKRGVGKLVTASPRHLGRYEEAPRPYEMGWVHAQIERMDAEKEAKGAIPIPQISSILDTNAIARVNEAFAARARYVDKKLRRYYPPR